MIEFRRINSLRSKLGLGPVERADDVNVGLFEMVEALAERADSAAPAHTHRWRFLRSEIKTLAAGENNNNVRVLAVPGDTFYCEECLAHEFVRS